MEKVCVLGAGSTKYGKLDDSISDITLQASVAAIESGVALNKIDIKDTDETGTNIFMLS